MKDTSGCVCYQVHGLGCNFEVLENKKSDDEWLVL